MNKKAIEDKLELNLKWQGKLQREEKSLRKQLKAFLPKKTRKTIKKIVVNSELT